TAIAETEPPRTNDALSASAAIVFFADMLSLFLLRSVDLT
ncbi:MAG: hypothetical protein RLZ06_752, partial [Actinomycetota bacterium]